MSISQNVFVGETVEIEDEKVLEILKGETVETVLTAFKGIVESSEGVDAELAKTIFKAVQKETGVKGKNLFMPVRAAVSGEGHGPDMGDVLVVLGKETILKRIDYVLKNYC